MAETINHIFVPKHIKLSEEEGKKILEKFNITLNQLPMIRKNDSAIRHMNAKHGDIIKIVRSSPTMIETEFYRMVTEE